MNEDIQEENLDKHHTHFFLVDDGYVNKPGGELLFRANFENAVMNLKIGNIFYWIYYKIKFIFKRNISAIMWNLLKRLKHYS